MVAYEDLVVALTNWRVNQGLPTGADAFAAFETGSVDLALPVADPVELTTGEVLAIDDDVESDVSTDPAGAVDNGADVVETEGLESFDSDEVAMDAEAFTATESLDYGEETAYGDMPEMDAAAVASGSQPPALEAPPSDDAALEVAMDDELQVESEVDADEMAVEEVEISADALDVEEVAVEEVAVEEVAVEEVAVEEVAISADSLPVEEVEADDFEALEVSADVFGGDEMPTKFGDVEVDDDESTVMGIGVDQMVPPDKA